MKKIILSFLLLVLALCGYAQKDTVITRTYRLNGVSSWAHDHSTDLWSGLHLEWLEAVRCDTGTTNKTDSILSAIDTDSSLTIRTRIIYDGQKNPDFYSMHWLGKDGAVTVSYYNQNTRRSEIPHTPGVICLTMHFSKHKCNDPRINNKKITSLTFNGQSYLQLDSTIKYEPGKFGIGYTMGGGGVLPYGTAKAWVNGGFVVNMNLFASYNKFHYSCQLTYNKGKIRNTLAFDPNWIMGNTFESLTTEGSIGYQLVNTKRFNIIPSASAGLITYTTMRDTLKIANTSNYFCWSAGVAFDIKFRTPARKGIKYPGYEHTVEYHNLRIFTGIRPEYFNRPFGLNSGLYFISVSYGGYVKGPRRKK